MIAAVDDAFQWRTMLRNHEGLSSSALLLGNILSRYWRGHRARPRPLSVCDVVTECAFTWEEYKAALAELQAFGFLTLSGRRGRPYVLFYPDLPSLHMAGAGALLDDYLGRRHA